MGVIASKTLHTQMPAKLTVKQELFLNNYLIDFNATAAAVRAGYSPKTAQEQSSRLLKHPAVSVAVDIAKAKAVEKVEVTVDKVLRDLEQARTAALDAGQFSPAVRASELQGKYLKMFFDGHQVEPTGLAAMPTAKLMEDLRALLGKDGLASIGAMTNYPG